MHPFARMGLESQVFALVMAVVNLTPDSFSDDGVSADPGRALDG